MLPKKLNTIDSGNAQLGWEFHGEGLHYFVFSNQLMHWFIRPAWRVHQPQLEIDGISKKLDAGGLSITGGFGIQF